MYPMKVYANSLHKSYVYRACIARCSCLAVRIFLKNEGQIRASSPVGLVVVRLLLGSDLQVASAGSLSSSCCYRTSLALNTCCGDPDPTSKEKSGHARFSMPANSIISKLARTSFAMPTACCFRQANRAQPKKKCTTVSIAFPVGVCGSGFKTQQ